MRGSVEENNAQFEGTLELAPGTEPYTIHATIFPSTPDDPPGAAEDADHRRHRRSSIRAYRRSFPFEAQMARIKDAVCHAPQTVSSLQ